MSRVSTQRKSAAPMFAALGSVTRLELISRLRDGNEHSITALTDDLTLTRQAVSKHLKVLQRAGMVNSRRVGTESRFAIQPASFLQARDYLARVSGQWDMAITRLRQTVER